MITFSAFASFIIRTIIGQKILLQDVKSARSSHNKWWSSLCRLLCFCMSSNEKISCSRRLITTD